MSEKHIDDHDLERYYLGIVAEEEEVAQLEEHILSCSWCAHRAEASQDYVDAIRVALDAYQCSGTRNEDKQPMRGNERLLSEERDS